MIILDTNVVSELVRTLPDLTVRDWVLSREASELFTTSITLAEIHYGIERLPEGKRKQLLKDAVSEVFKAFRDHVLAFDATAAVHYAFIVSDRDRLGMPIDGFDAQIASICRVHGAALATRNLKDFQGVGIDLIDPWQDR